MPYTKIKSFEALFSFATMGILITDSRGKIVAINPFALQEFGYKEEDLTGKSIEQLIPTRFKNTHMLHRETYAKHPYGRPMGAGLQLFALRKDGSEFPVEISLSPYEADGENFVIAFINNITIRKNTEAQIKKLNEELEATVEKRTRDLKETMRHLEIARDRQDNLLSFQKALLDNAGAMIIALDPRGIIKLFNPEAVLILGYSESEIINNHSITFFLDKAELEHQRNKIAEELKLVIDDDFQVLIEKTKRNIHEEQEFTFRRKDQTALPVSMTIASIYDAEDQLLGFVAIAIDISVRKRSEEKLRSSLEKERELSELKSRFVSMASHEFRTPLTTILSSSYLIEQYANEADRQKRQKHLQRIVSSVNMLADILNDFLSAGRIEEGKIQAKLMRFEIEESITNVINEIADNIKKNQSLNYVHNGYKEVVMDPSLLKYIVINLVSNASKFSAHDAIINVATTCNNGKIILSVKDHGMGISAEDQKHLTERFFRGTNATDIQGTGLGLHIVAKYTELMKGTLCCHSELEKGTEFILTFDQTMSHENDTSN
ncbi:PAS domain-containing sensor histidine kinase [Chitinophagaceae bacterium 26-R-25]|nr:PAS domain-containing sensor histidine kinase [Chitinophagaceae bacterium 26-R-25]